VFLGVVLVAVVLAPATAAPKPRLVVDSAADHLALILDRSPAPSYRRAGSEGMERVAAYEAKVLRQAGYRVVRQNVPFTAWAVDYSDGHAPLLERVDDGKRFKAESVFRITAPGEVTCTVKALDDVGKGDCGFVPFGSASPEWKRVPISSTAEAFTQIREAEGVGAVVQGDDARDAVFANSVAQPLTAVVSPVAPEDVIGKTVRVRAMGGSVPAVARNVIGVRPPPPGGTDYVMLLAHADGWFQAAADNGGGVAAVLRAAELLASRSPGVGVVAALVDGEEVGYHGSKALAAQLATPEGLAVGDDGFALHMSDLAAVINLDASSARASEIQDPVREVKGGDAPVFSWRLMVHSEHATLPALFMTTFAEHGVMGMPMGSQAVRAIYNGSWRTDAGFFHDAGVPVVWPVAGYPEYHTDADDLDVVDAVDLEKVAAASADLVTRLAGVPRSPVLDS
jgi:hypothetical protein